MVTTLRQQALKALRKKLIGKKLNYKEFYAIIHEIANGKAGDIITTYFAAAGFVRKFTREELYYLTRAMIETGEKLSFEGIVADKHSIGGVAGYRTTLVLVPIIAASGLKIPKTSSRAITSPAGTADVMEVLAPVKHSPEKIKMFVNKVGGCIVWGGVIHLAPADDEIIEVERAISFESYDKIVASVMAKKIAAGSNHIVIDIPYGREAKVTSKKKSKFLANKFKFIAKKFKIKLSVSQAHINYPLGKGVGAVLEAREALRILQQKPNRSLPLEERILELTSALLELCGRPKYQAKEILVSGRAWRKFQEIITIQGGKPEIDSEELSLGSNQANILSSKTGIIQRFYNENIIQICRLLGCPLDKKAGIYFPKLKGEKVKKGEVLFTLYSSDKMKLEKALALLKEEPIVKIL
jgi:AMP phosphorylase